MHEVLVNRLGGLSLPRKSVIRLTDCPDMTLNVYGGRKTTTQQQQQSQSKNSSKLLISQSKFSGTRKFTLRYQQFEIKGVET